VKKSYSDLFPVWPGTSTSPAVLTITANGNDEKGLESAGSYQDLIIHLEITAFSGSGTITFAIDEWVQGTNNWVNIATLPVQSGVTAAPVRQVVAGPFGERLRLSWTITGTPTVTPRVGATLLTND